MATGRIKRSARRGLAAIVLGWLAILVGSVLLAPSASADSQVDFPIRDLTPPLVSVDAGGTVTFSNLIQDKPVQVGGDGLLPSLVTVVVHTDVTLGVPSGAHPLQGGKNPADRWTETFPSSCVGCTITYTYRVTVPDSSIVGGVLDTVTGQAIAAMPQNQVVSYNGQQTTVTIGVPTPFVVNTLLPLPNLPSVNLPQVPQVTVQVPQLGGAPTPQAGTVPGTQTVTTTTTTTTTGTTPQIVPGTQYTYDTGAGAPQMAPVDTAAAAAFDPSRFFVPGQSVGTPDGSSSTGGAGGVAGQYDGASVPVFGQLAGLNGSDLEEADSAAAAPGSASAPALPVPALAAVVALAAVTAALVRTPQAHRAAQRSR